MGLAQRCTTLAYFRISLRLEVSEEEFVKKKLKYLTVFKTHKPVGTVNLPKKAGRN